MVEGVDDPNKARLDISTQCSSMFNFSVRPRIDVEKVDEKKVLKIFVSDLSSTQKPLYFKNVGISQGTWRRIGSNNQRCMVEELSFDDCELLRSLECFTSDHICPR